MFVPEYTITSKILKSIATIEYGKAIIESTVVLQTWESQVQSQTLIDEICANLQLEGFNITSEQAKKTLENLTTSPTFEVQNTKQALSIAVKMGSRVDLDENDLKTINNALTGRGNYRSVQVAGKTKPAEILAEIVELFDWLNSMDARESHPIVVAAIARARLEEITPFENYNSTTANVATLAILRAFNYALKDFIDVSSYYSRGKKDFLEHLKELKESNNDFTRWIEYFCEGFATQVASTQEKVKLLAKDTKLAKASGRTRLTPRQEKIVEYLQDYGVLQNKDFPRLFPDKSEDSILRDMKVLIDQSIVRKVGSTKSSRYELK